MNKLSLISLLSLSLLACGGEQAGTTETDSGPGPSTGAPNQLDVRIEGQGAATLTGQAQSTLPQQFSAAVTGGELTVHLLSSDGSIVFFRVDMTRAPLPGKTTAGASLQDTSFLTVTSAGGIFESTGAGDIVVDQCPDAQGKELSGSFDKVALKSPFGGSSTLSGSFKVQIAVHDGSHKCSGGKPSDVEGPPGCEVKVCDGPCCPYQACMAGCLTGCMQSKCQGLDVMGCFSCMQGCPDTCNVSAQCKGCLGTLDGCAQQHQCEPLPAEESACVGQHCCAEYRACF
jgi:hypothetical protein